MVYMRPVRTEQNPLRYPLNELLGTRANVRLLRVMANEVDGPLTVSEVANRSGLTVPGAQKALSALVESGFVTPVGGGRTRQYEIRRPDSLMRIIIELFETEKNRYTQMIASLKKNIKSLTPAPDAAWISDIPKKFGDPVILSILHDSRYLDECTRRLRADLNRVERDFEITFELAGYTKADMPQVKSEGITLLFGLLPSGSYSLTLSNRKPATHQEKDRWHKELSQNLAKAIESDSSLIRRAKEHVERLIGENQGMANRDLMEWRDILEMHSTTRLTKFITSSSARAERLRQSNPFLAVLTAEERKKLIADQ
jgi:predicted transcriptional regulator